MMMMMMRKKAAKVKAAWAEQQVVAWTVSQVYLSCVVHMKAEKSWTQFRLAPLTGISLCVCATFSKGTTINQLAKYRLSRVCLCGSSVELFSSFIIQLAVRFRRQPINSHTERQRKTQKWSWASMQLPLPACRFVSESLSDWLRDIKSSLAIGSTGIN